MKSIFKLTFIFCILMNCFACNAQQNQEKNTDIIENDYFSIYDSINEKVKHENHINNPFNKEILKVFLKSCDSILSLDLKEITPYKVKKEKIITSTYFYEYFEADSLIDANEYKFYSKTEDYRNNFSLSVFEYSSPITSSEMLNRISTINYNLDDGLNKQFAYVFRINNFIFWLDIPHKMKEKFEPLKESLNFILRKHTIENMNERYFISKETNYDNDGIIGKWECKKLASLYVFDTLNKKNYNGEKIEIQNSKNRYPTKKVFPDIQSFLEYQHSFKRYQFKFNPKIKDFFEGPVLIITLESLYNYKFLKMRNNQFGFIVNDDLYLLLPK